MKKFKQLINESRGACGVKFGKHLFGEYLKKAEKDTKDEREIFYDIIDWLMNGISTKKIQNSLKHLQKCKTYYSNILTPNKVNTMFRAIVYNEDYWKLQVIMGGRFRPPKTPHPLLGCRLGI
jgi:hypothetical protein